MTFTSLVHVAIIFGTSDKKCRIILERGDSETFLVEAEDLLPIAGVTHVVIKKGWIMLKDSGHAFKDYSYIPWFSGVSWIENLRRFKLDTIWHHARRVNPKITEAMIADPNIIYFMDCI